MSNNLGFGSGFTKEVWDIRVQRLLKNNLVALAICSEELRAGLYNGFRTNRPIPSQLYAQTYVKGVSAVNQDISSSPEFLDVDTAKIVPFKLDDIDKIQTAYSTLDIFATRSAYELRNQIDFTVLAEGAANSALGNTINITLSTSNVSGSFSQAKADLFNNGVEEDMPWYTVMDGDSVSTIEQFRMANGFNTADEVIIKGYGLAAYLGEWEGLKCFKSQNLPTVAVLSSATQPNDGEVVKINGILFTAKTTLSVGPAVAGEFLIGGSADAARANLTALINDPFNALASTNYTALTNTALQPDATNVKRRNLVAVNDNTANTLTLTAAGKMVLPATVAGKTFWASATWGTQTMGMLVGQMGNIDLVLQKDVSSEFTRLGAIQQVGTQCMTWTLYGKKMFTEGKQRSYTMTVTK